METLYRQHVAHVQELYGNACQESALKCDGILVHSGSEHCYYGDDRHIPFQAFGHFLYWLPVNRPDQFVLYRHDRQPVFYQVVLQDYWYDQNVTLPDFCSGALELIRCGSVEEVATHIGDNLLYMGPESGMADRLGCEPITASPAGEQVVATLDFQRAYKTEYELAQLRDANRLGLLGHDAARACFEDGGNEYDIHLAFLRASGQLDNDSPYTNIVALDQHAAILHYQHKSRANQSSARVLLIDAGCRVHGYGSDITRTWVRDTAHPVFTDLRNGLEEIELALVSEVAPGKPYPTLHDSALRQLSQLLLDTGVVTGSTDELLEKGISQRFLPHGVGHLLGIQVHDVGGHQANRAGDPAPPPPNAPALRNTRMMDADMVFTIEPGCYFIPMLLDPLRNETEAGLVNWGLVDELMPLGGIRIEDNVRVTTEGAENLTRGPQPSQHL